MMRTLYADLSDDLELCDELVDVLADDDHVRIERIVSTGQASPDGFWYDCEQVEWVALLKGEAKLRIEGQHEPLHLKPGDHLTIPAHLRHRIEWTSADQPTVWLAVFYPGPHNQSSQSDA